jgi:N4-gp56 family major capsid protein
MTPVFYGAYIIYTDELEMTAFDPIVSEFTSILGEQAGLSADTIYRTEMITDCTTDYTNGAAAIGTLAHPAYDVSYADVVYQVAELEAQSALPMENDNFIVILHPHSYASLMQDEVFVNMFEKESDPAMRSGYVGRLLRCIFFVTANAYEQADTGSGSTTDVYSMLFLGRESYGSLGIGNLEPSVVDNQGDNGRPLTGQQIRPVEVIMKGLGSGGSVDPLDQRGTLAWKMALDVEVLNSSWIRNLKHTNVFSDD